MIAANVCPMKTSGQIVEFQRRLRRVANAVDDRSRAIDDEDDPMRWPSTKTEEQLPQSERMQVSFKCWCTTIGDVAESCDRSSDRVIPTACLLAGSIVPPPDECVLNVSFREVRKLDFEHQSP